MSAPKQIAEWVLMGLSVVLINSNSAIHSCGRRAIREMSLATADVEVLAFNRPSWHRTVLKRPQERYHTEVGHARVAHGCVHGTPIDVARLVCERDRK